MMLIADAHVHIYPCYNLKRFFECAASHLTALAPPGGAATLALCLTEARGNHAFQDLRDGRAKPPAPFAVRPTLEPATLLVERESEPLLYLVAGRQIVTYEGLEVSAPALADVELPDGYTLVRVLDAIREAGATPVLNWALGKWLFRRGRIVANLVEHAARGTLALCDTAMRPRGWPPPGVFRRARKAGLTLVAGSDPLPLAGEERYAGAYAFVADVPEVEGPAAAVRAALAGRASRIEIAGRRPALVTVLRRWKAHREQRARAG